jgi:hypothetical protein
MNRILHRVVAAFLVFFVSSATEPLLAQDAAQQAAPASQQPAPASQQPAAQQAPPGQGTLPPVELPENPGKNSGASQPQQATPPPEPQKSAPAAPQPNGTAVAPPVQVSGGAASKPAGVAIAPPKQRQVRSLLIKLGLIAGVGAAVGTVVGLSAASPSHVPGSGH